MLSFRSCVVGLCLPLVLLLFGLLTNHAAAQSVTVVNIVDSANAPYTGFNEFCLNNVGTVAFTATRNAGGSGIYTGNGGTLVTIADTDNAGFDAIESYPALNDSGTVVFYAYKQNVRAGIYSGNGGVLTTVATTDGSTFSDFGLPFSGSINNAGTVAFSGSRTDGNSGVYSGSGGAITTIAERSSPIVELISRSPVINDSGVVAFEASPDRGGAGIYTGSGGALTPIVQTTPTGSTQVFFPMINSSGAVAFLATTGLGERSIHVGSGGALTTIVDAVAQGFSHLDTPALNDSGVVVFVARTGMDTQAIYTGSGGSLTRIAASDDVFASFYSNPRINNSGTVAFRSGLRGGEGIFAALSGNSAPISIIGAGSLLFGSPVTGLLWGNGGLNDASQIVFRYDLQNGRSGIAVATITAAIVPEPGTGLLAAVATGLGIVRWVRHKRAL